MNKLEELHQEAFDQKVDIVDFDFSGTRLKGLYCDGAIALDKRLDTYAQKTSVLAEELGHHYTSTGNILNQSDIGNRKQELHARVWGYNKLIV